MKIKMITGSFPPDICGVGDYTAVLAKKLEEKELDIGVFNYKEWKVKNIFKIKNEICKEKSDIYHLQYPTQGYGYSLVPSFLSLLLFRKKFIVTLHEFTSKSLKGKIAELFLVFFSKHTIFTTDYERKALLKLLPFKKNKSSVINIGSNIEFVNENISLKKYDVIYFGHIRPMKGIEEFIDSSRIVSDNINFYIIGQVLPEYKEYYEKLKAENLKIEFIINKSMHEVKNILAQTKIAYLHFPDGVSYRRGSFLAAFGNGAEIITTSGNDTPKIFNRYCSFINTPKEAAEKINEIILKDEGYFESREKIRREFVKSVSWDYVVQMHKNIYKKVLGEKNEDIG